MQPATRQTVEGLGAAPQQYCLALLVGTALILLTLGLTACGTPVLDVDVAQERLDSATPALNGSHALVQSFRCARANLSQIELLPAVYETPGEGILTIRLRSPGTGPALDVASQSFEVQVIRHNSALHFAFPPQRDSAGQEYELLIEGAPGVGIGLWYNSVDAYGGGELTLDGQTVGDLRFVTRSAQDVASLAREANATLTRNIWLIIPIVALLAVPGCLIWHSLGLARAQDPISSAGFGLALSLAFVPLTFLWSSAIGVRWGRTLCLGFFAALGLCVVVCAKRGYLRDLMSWAAPRNRCAVLAVTGVLVLTVWLRVIQVRSLALPAWVDSPQHVLVTQLLTEHGQVPGSYEPFLPVSSFIYHFGFHAETAFFHWLTDLPIPQAMLILGQVLNAASALMAYVLAARMTGRRAAAISAALIVGCVSYMPAYYVSWGRYTQLTGLLLLPAGAALSLDWLEGRKRDHRLLLVAAMLHAGLFLIHARVSIFAACFLASVLVCKSTAMLLRKDRTRMVELWVRSFLLALLAVVLSSPWLVQLIRGMLAALQAAGTTLRGDPEYNLLPRAFLFAPRNLELMALATVGAAVGLLRRRKETVWVLGWVGLVALVVNPGWIGLPTTNLVNNATAAISLFLPLSVLGGQACGWLWDIIPSAASTVVRRGISREHAATAARALLAAVFVCAALWSVWCSVSIVNPLTVLATDEDIAAMQWIRENTPPDAVFLINARHWQLGFYVGTDGGYWIPQLTGRRTLLPALAYSYGDPDYVLHITEMALVVSEAHTADDLHLQSLLDDERVTHVYLGAEGGPLTAQMFLHGQRYRPVYCSGAVWIFEVRGQAEEENRASLRSRNALFRV